MTRKDHRLVEVPMAPPQPVPSNDNGNGNGDESPAVRYGRSVRDLLALKGRRQADVAAELGISRAVLNNWIHGRREPSPEQAIALERLLGAAPGSTTQHLGFVPPASADLLDVSDLTAEQVQLLQLTTAAWREMNRAHRRPRHH